MLSFVAISGGKILITLSFVQLTNIPFFKNSSTIFKQESFNSTPSMNHHDLADPGSRLDPTDPVG